MRAQERPSLADGMGIGIVFAAAGGYFMLAALGVVPSPGTANGPAWIVFCAGLAFLFAGLAVIVRTWAGVPDSRSDMPDDAPLWARVSYRTIGIAVAGTLALIGTWVAIGDGPRAFTFSGPHLEMRTGGEVIGRTVFGLGAVIVWIYVIALTVGTVRKFLDRRGG